MLKINTKDRVFTIAAFNGHLHVVQYLEEKGTNIPAVHEWALWNAAMNGHLHIVQYLVERGADIHANKDEAFRHAAYYGHLHVVQYLVERGADINKVDLRWVTAIKHPHVVQYLQNIITKAI